MVKLAELERNNISKVVYFGLSHKKDEFPNKLPIQLNGYDIRYGKDKWSTYVVTVWDNTTEVMSLAMNLINFYSIKGYVIDSAIVSPEYQGKGLGYQLYTKLVTEMDMVLVSQDSHSTGARKLWVKLSRDPLLSVYGFDLIAKKVFKVKPNKDKTELTTKLQDLYDKKGTGVIVVRKGSVNNNRLNNMLKAAQLA